MSNHLKTLREKHGLTASALAHDVNLSSSALLAIERGGGMNATTAFFLAERFSELGEPFDETLKRLCDPLGRQVAGSKPTGFSVPLEPLEYRTPEHDTPQALYIELLDTLRHDPTNPRIEKIADALAAHVLRRYQVCLVGLLPAASTMYVVEAMRILEKRGLKGYWRPAHEGRYSFIWLAGENVKPHPFASAFITGQS